MDTKYIDEQWMWLEKGSRDRRNIVAISNTGKYRKANGDVGILSLRHCVRYDGNRERCYRLIAENFLITVKRPDQCEIDHVEHDPAEYNVNDVRNLRYCTHTENMAFEEHRENLSKSMECLSGSKHPMYGRTGDKSPTWKGDDVGPEGAYCRAKKLYKAGKLTEEEFQSYRCLRAKYRRERKATRSHT